MSLLVTLLATIAMGDLARAHARLWHPRTAARSAILGTVTFVAADFAVGGTPPWWIACVAFAVAAWLTVSDLPSSSKLSSLAIERARWGSLVILGGSILLAIGLQPLNAVVASPLEEWYRSLTLQLPIAPTVEGGVLLLSVLVFHFGTANVIVRLVLRLPLATNAPAETSGGRLIGSLERVLIFFLALAGEALAIGAVIAAKGLLRFPEISTPSEGESIGNKAEQVIVGSLLSWLLALVFVPFFVL